jgi:hypothetical protein
MIRLMISLVLTSAIAATSAMARNRHGDAPFTQNGCDASPAGPYVGYDPCNDPNAVYVGGTYAGSDPDPNIQAALAREFGKRR